MIPHHTPSPFGGVSNHSGKAALEQEVRGLRAEVDDLTRLNRMLREEIELIKEEHVAVTLQVRVMTVLYLFWVFVGSCLMCS